MKKVATYTRKQKPGTGRSGGKAKRSPKSIRESPVTGEVVDFGGRPPLWTDPKKFDAAVKAYFNNKSITHTWTGLALHLNFCSRQSLEDYKKVEGFKESIKFALLKIENKYEERLNESKVPVGAIFALKNLNWADKQEIKHVDQPNTSVTVNIVKPKDED